MGNLSRGATASATMIGMIGELGLVFFVAFLLPIFPFLPLRLAFIIPLVATNVSPIVVALTAALGASLGTVPLYGLSVKARDVERMKTWLRRRWFRRLLQALEGKMFLLNLLVALFPIPDQLMSIVGGLKRYPLSRMMAAFFIGRLPYFLLLGYLGSTNREAIERTWQGILELFKI